ncbi:efflux RND transporter permease subunit [Salinisphaera japonica]|uniref:Acriflavin resistance protein n=1 Tax=Salinisphaera japonica YTM-1 TaxID=1209778 RepID=A0A423PJN6_9GAMM|nr:efflux RND transporter permease subunit [Salinisphaera japonica]ROO25807.1 acriflavin resistance protein [Salinisphaera japonica YTM-1]
MTDWSRHILGQSRLIAALVTVFALAGIAAYIQMNRQENPSFPYRVGIITVAFPGAAPGRIERLVARPLEREIAGVSEVQHIETTLRQGVGIFTVQLGDSVYDTDSAWDRVRRAMEIAARDYPQGVGQAELDDRIIDASLMVVALTGPGNTRDLAHAAKRLRRHLQGVGGISDIRLFGDPGRQITVALDDAVMSRYGLSPDTVARDISNSNQTLDSGQLTLDDRSVNLSVDSDYGSLTAIRATAIGLPGGDTLPLGALAHVYTADTTPPAARVLTDGEPAVALEIVAARGRNTVELGARLKQAVTDFAPELAPARPSIMFYQPAQTEARLTSLSINLLASIAIILLVLFVFMGLRLGVVVAVLLPLVTLTTIALYALGGGILQQVAIIGLVVALGILVDNAIVMSEEVQARLNEGQAPGAAAAGAIASLAGPLFAATGTTLAAFVPMLLAQGNTADFTRALPITIMTALSVSYLFAITVTPLLSRGLLRPARGAGTGVLDRLGVRLARLTGRRPVLWVLGGGAVFVAAMATLPLLDQQFFPPADRDVVVVDLSLPEGTALARTENAATALAAALRPRADVRAIETFIGNGGPTFFYNLRRAPAAPHLARLVVKTRDIADNAAIIDAVADYHRQHLADGDLIARTLGQGPVVPAPIAVRVFNDDADRLATATQRVTALTQQIAGTRDVRNDLGIGIPSLRYDVQRGIAQAFGVAPVDISQTLAGRSTGRIVGQYRGDVDPMPIRIVSPEGMAFDPVALATATVHGDRGASVPLMQVATPHLALAPGSIRHYDQRPVAHVYTELTGNAVYSQVLAPLQRAIAGADLPPGTTIAYGGNAEESGKANTALFSAAPLGIGLLLFFLLIQFNSFRRVGLVLMTAPFAAVGVIPGLLLLGIPFGFMPLLGMIALTGIVVNNAIVLIDVVDQRLAEGQPIDTAVADAVRRRTRPILLTTATTIAGLLPLALSEATLWPPMAWPIITGLAAATLLTLLVLPAMCRLLLGRPRGRKTPPGASAAVLVTGLFMAVPCVGAAERPASDELADAPTISLAEAFAGAARIPGVARSQQQQASARAAADRIRRAGRYPTLSARASAERNSEVARLDTQTFGDDLGAAADLPDGQTVPDVSIPLGDRDQLNAAIELRQPLLDIATQVYAAPAQASTVAAAGHVAERAVVQARLAAAQAYVEALSLRQTQRARGQLLTRLNRQYEQITQLRAQGRALKSDVAEVRYARARASGQLDRTNADYVTACIALGQAVGRDQPVIPGEITHLPPERLADVTTLVATAHDHRADLAAISDRIAAARLQVKAVAAQRLPSIDAVASYNVNQGNVFLPDSAARIGAELTWRPFAGGQLIARKREAEAEVAALMAARQATINEITLAVRRARDDYGTALTQLSVARLGRESAIAQRETLSAQRSAGRATISQLVEAETRAAERESDYRRSRYQLVLAWQALQAALGRPPATDALTRRIPD